MVLTLESAGALVPGAKIKEENVETKTVKVLRGFFDGKNSLKPGDIVTLSASLARQAKDAHKIEYMPDEPKPSKVESPKAEVRVIAPDPESEKPEEANPEGSNPEPKEKSKKYGKY